jgi:hypothetical protein
LRPPGNIFLNRQLADFDLTLREPLFLNLLVELNLLVVRNQRASRV